MVITLINTCHCCVADPDPPTGVSVVPGTECGTADVSWSPSQVNYNAVIGNYSVRYRQRSRTGGYTTVYSSNTSVTLRGLDPSVEYSVEVAAIDLCGRMSGLSMVAQLNLQGNSMVYSVSVIPTYTYMQAILTALLMSAHLQTMLLFVSIIRH